MGNRYWVGGAALWDTLPGTKWATSSGGVGGAGVPATFDNVFFDSHSGNHLVSIGSGATCYNLDTTGFTGTLSFGSGLAQTGSKLIFGSGTSFSGSSTITANADAIVLNGVSLTCPVNCTGGDIGITSNGGIFTAGLTIAVTSTALISDDLSCGTNTFTISSGTVTIGSSTINAGRVVLISSSTKVINLGSDFWNISGTGTVWDFQGDSASHTTINGETSTIKLTDPTSTPKTWNGGGLIYNNLWIQGGSGVYTIQGSNTFNSLKMDGNFAPVNNLTVNFTAGTTTTLTTMSVTGSSFGAFVTLGSTGSPVNLICASGAIDVSYCLIQSSHASGGATFTAQNSVDGGGNTGWVFGGGPSPGTGSQGLIMCF
jgi:hypothetical protein